MPIRTRKIEGVHDNDAVLHLDSAARDMKISFQDGGGIASNIRIFVINLRLCHLGFGGDSPDFNDRGKGGDKPEFADLVTGKCKGRTSRDQITFYRNVGNQGLQFSSVGGFVYQQAVKQKKGREIPTDWFLQDIRD